MIFSSFLLLNTSSHRALYSLDPHPESRLRSKKPMPAEERQKLLEEFYKYVVGNLWRIPILQEGTESEWSCNMWCSGSIHDYFCWIFRCISSVSDMDNNSTIIWRYSNLICVSKGVWSGSSWSFSPDFTVPTFFLFLFFRSLQWYWG